MTASGAQAVQGDPVARARMMLQAAGWAASRFEYYDRAAVTTIVDAVARAGYEHAGEYADWAVRETGFGVVEYVPTCPSSKYFFSSFPMSRSPPRSLPSSSVILRQASSSFCC